MSRYKSEPPWKIEEILEILPHRYPFLLVDRVVRVNETGTDENREGSEIWGLKNVTMNEPFFTGHFPGRPIMPGVLVIEALAQICAILSARPVPAKPFDG